MNKILKSSFFLAFIVTSLTFSSFSSCEKPVKEEDVTISVAIKNATVANSAANQWIEITCSGTYTWELSLEFENGVEPWASINNSTGSGSGSVSLKWTANEGDNARRLNVVLGCAGKTDSVVMTQEGQGGNGGGDNQGGSGGNNPGGTDRPEPSGDPDAITNWMELPAVSADLKYYNHSFTFEGKSYRNFSIGWDETNLLAHWVAYPLCKFYTTDRTKRTDDWQYDPKVKTTAQPTLYKGYKASLSGGYLYDRGHQLPSADRLCTREANEQTFYFTNMTAQEGQLNQKNWANFETKVRKISERADTLYVVTGCTVNGSTKKAYDNNGIAVTVPTGYFKALLYYNKANTFGKEGYSAAGFYFDHKAGATAQKMTIDALEELTGIDFFVNLPAKIGQVNADFVEKEDPSSTSIWN